MDNINGIKKSLINELDNIKGSTIEKYKLISSDIAFKICEITEKINREIAIYIDRKGEVIDYSIGDENTVILKELSIRRSEESLSGIRCIHTHPNGNGRLSDIDISALGKMKFDIIASIGVLNGMPCDLYFSYMDIDDSGKLIVAQSERHTIDSIQSIDIIKLIDYIEKRLRETKPISYENCKVVEKAVLVGVESINDLDELSELLDTAGGIELARIVQNRNKVDTSHFIGKGKLKELQLTIQSLDANLVVFDEQLSGAQIKNLEEYLNIKVIDRTQLILDIFAQRANSREGKLQVELAQLKYMMPRLIGLGTQMSRSGGGIGTRGPGEKKLEIDRRRIRDKINDLQNEVEELKKQRSLQRKSREGKNIFKVCLVGYTNAGKSTLLNILTNSNIYAMDQLFATLDTTTRKVNGISGREVLITDTVGFIRKLPHDLVKAFKSTLEEVLYADLLIHVVDISNEDYETQEKVVLQVLQELGADDKPMITAYNKYDKVDKSEISISSNLELKPLFISAKNNIGVDELIKKIEDFVTAGSKEAELLIPYANGSVLSIIHDNCNIISEQYRENGVYIKAVLDKTQLGKLGDYII